MPRKSSQPSMLGRALIKDRFGKKKGTYIHAAELSGDVNKATDNLKSVTEHSSLEDFLATAEMSGRDFTAQRMNVQYIDSNQQGLVNANDEQRLAIQEEIQHLVSIPMRPKWNESMTKQELESKENESFLAWRRQLAEIEEKGQVLFTPYEKNLNFWRQLWRVVERSDVIVQIVDARNPLLFRCENLEAYVGRVDPSKKNLLLINKADLLSANQREAWLDYFDRIGVRIVFWSALSENEKLDALKREGVEGGSDVTRSESEDGSDVTQSDSEDGSDVTRSECEDEELSDKSEEKDGGGESLKSDEDCASADEGGSSKRHDLFTRQELIELFKSLVDKETKVIGMVGYPNVGKSSTVNTLLGIKKAGVSATPGRTKHFQTLLVDAELCLCDCPGLVFPTFATSKADMILNGILPIDQMRDHVPATNLLGCRIPRQVIEGTYGINIVKPGEGQDPHRPATANEILSAHALSRGFMTSKGQPDCSRSSRVLLKDYVNGKLLYSLPPPDFDEEIYQSWTTSVVALVLNKIANNLTISEDMQTVAARIHRVNKTQKVPINEVDRDFFNSNPVQLVAKEKARRSLKNGKLGRNVKKEKSRRIRKVDKQ